MWKNKIKDTQLRERHTQDTLFQILDMCRIMQRTIVDMCRITRHTHTTHTIIEYKIIYHICVCNVIYYIIYTLPLTEHDQEDSLPSSDHH
jgi:hypothetical protein